MKLAVLVLSVFCYMVSAHVPCTPRGYGKDSFVCVCSASTCDDVEDNTKQPKGVMVQYKSSAAKYRLEKNTFKFEANATGSYVYKFDRTTTHQTIIGFGGAFTDAAGINIMNLSPKAQDKLLASYYSPTGIQYTVGRIPMASCDFSTHPYSYDDTPGDFNLTHFALAPEDLKYKIPIIQRALAMSNRKISIFGSPWSAPAWMKTNNNMTGKGSLIGKAGGPYHKTWANYFIRFLQEYEKHNISLWGLTAQNEPSDGEITKFLFQAMGWTAEQQRDFIVSDLGPALHNSGYDNIKLMMLDDTRLFLPEWAETVLSDSSASKFIAGIAIHWYLDAIIPVNILSIIHKQFPDKFILSTEACNGEFPWNAKVSLGDWSRAKSYVHDIIQVFSNTNAWKFVSGIGVHWYQDSFIPTITLENMHKEFPSVFILATEASEGALLTQHNDVVLGSWSRAQAYAHSIIEDINHWVTGWTDWNIALDTEGGPNWVKNFVDSPIIVNATAQEFYKQPMFYALGHFSKFVVPGSKRIAVSVNSQCKSLESVGFLLPDNSVVFVIHNNANSSYDISLEDPAIGTANVRLEPLSINTFTWWNS